MTIPPPLTGQLIGEAERATRALLDGLLAEVETSFTQWVTLNITATIGSGSLDENELVRRVARGLSVDDATAQATLDELEAAGLLTRAATRVELSGAGTARVQRILSGIGEISARLYGDVPSEDLDTTRRVLATVAERARAELAG
jgi:DNA-binding MarR family transcriptional regulator